MSGDARILIETSPGQSRALYLVDGQLSKPGMISIMTPT